MNQPGEHSKTEQFLRLLANQMCSQRRRGAKLLRLLAIGGQEEKRPFAVFFRAPPVILNAQLTTDAIEVPNTDVDVELFLQRGLHLTAWHLWIGAAGRNQPLEYGFSQFRWIPMSPIEERGLSP